MEILKEHAETVKTLANASPKDGKFNETKGSDTDSMWAKLPRQKLPSLAG